MTESAPTRTEPLDRDLLPHGIRSRLVAGINGLTMHVLEAGFDAQDGHARPRILLLHGFPELAYSWRKIMLPLAAAGYHVIAPDQRGYGRTIGWDGDYDGDLKSFGILNLVRDALGLIHAMGYATVEAVVGHDFGSSVAAWCALLRPDVFKTMVLMSAPFAGPPVLPVGGPRRADDVAGAVTDVHQALAALPRPRKHYQWYYSTRQANEDMHRPPQGLHDFLRAYYHHKSADWKENRPQPLPAWTAAALQQLPTYYVMDLDEDMAQTVAHEMPSAEAIAANRWLPDHELRVYSDEFGRTGFQGALQWYRNLTDPRLASDLQIWSGCTIDVPACFIAGASDWGIHQRPGVLDLMREQACTRMSEVHLIDGAGHWVQQEQPDEVARLLLAFLTQHRSHRSS